MCNGATKVENQRNYWMSTSEGLKGVCRRDARSEKREVRTQSYLYKSFHRHVCSQYAIFTSSTIVSWRILDTIPSWLRVSTFSWYFSLAVFRLWFVIPGDAQALGISIQRSWHIMRSDDENQNNSKWIMILRWRWAIISHASSICYGFIITLVAKSLIRGKWSRCWGENDSHALEAILKYDNHCHRLQAVPMHTGAICVVQLDSWLVDIIVEGCKRGLTAHLRIS